MFIGKSFVNAATTDTKKITVTGSISYYIKENGSSDAATVKKYLNNYPFTLYYEDKYENIFRKSLHTQDDGSYSILIESSIEVKKVS